MNQLKTKQLKKVQFSDSIKVFKLNNNKKISPLFNSQDPKQPTQKKIINITRPKFNDSSKLTFIQRVLDDKSTHYDVKTIKFNTLLVNPTTKINTKSYVGLPSKYKRPKKIPLEKLIYYKSY